MYYTPTYFQHLTYFYINFQINRSYVNLLKYLIIFKFNLPKLFAYHIDVLLNKAVFFFMMGDISLKLSLFEVTKIMLLLLRYEDWDLASKSSKSAVSCCLLAKNTFLNCFESVALFFTLLLRPGNILSIKDPLLSILFFLLFLSFEP